MAFLRHIVTKKITASAFIVLLLFMHAVKVFHTHHQTANYNAAYAHALKSPFDAAQKAIITSRCLICDFCFLRDVDVTNYHIAIQQPAFAAITNSEHLTFIVCSAHLAVTGRGPPAIL